MLHGRNLAHKRRINGARTWHEEPSRNQRSAPRSGKSPVKAVPPV
jgi:hypothetical protein